MSHEIHDHAENHCVDNTDLPEAALLVERERAFVLTDLERGADRGFAIISHGFRHPAHALCSVTPTPVGTLAPSNLEEGKTPSLK